MQLARDIPLEWRCRRCGECCRHLVGVSAAGKFGMAVLPCEKRRLKGGKFKPLASNGKTVTLFQFSKDVCPFLKNSLCTVYEKRPLSCRAFRCNGPDAEYVAKVMGVLNGAKWIFNLENGKWIKRGEGKHV